MRDDRPNCGWRFRSRVSILRLSDGGETSLDALESRSFLSLARWIQAYAIFRLLIVVYVLRGGLDIALVFIVCKGDIRVT